MKCPLYFIGRTTVIPRESANIGDCFKEECAWWLDEMDRCAILELASSACALAEHLSVIREYGPGNEPDR